MGQATSAASFIKKTMTDKSSAFLISGARVPFFFLILVCPAKPILGDVARVE